MLILTTLCNCESTIQSTHTANLQLGNLPPKATHTDMFPALNETNLLSIGQLCDAGCTCTFTKHNTTIKCNNNTSIKGTCTTTEPKLWQINLTPHQVTIYAITAVNQSAKPANQVAFSHATLFSPTIATLAAAPRKNYLVNFPGLTKESLKKYPPQSMPTIKGRLDQTRLNKKRAKRTQLEPPYNPINPTNTVDLDVHPNQITQTYKPTIASQP
jgi:hypothetical protein